jgi:preprotein translocase subunit SecE
MAKKEKKDAKQKSSYFKEMKAELKKVVWPTPKELVNNTVAVIVFVLVIAIIVFVLDFCFDNLNKYGITRLQEKVQSSFQTTNDSEDNNEVSNETTDSETENSENNESTENLENISVENSEENNTESNE